MTGENNAGTAIPISPQHNSEELCNILFLMCRSAAHELKYKWVGMGTHEPICVFRVASELQGYDSAFPNIVFEMFLNMLAYPM